ncbi:MAG: LCP family protein [Clostridia bacterium]|nr:LCP family protein [Clostridia bacterium]
MQLNAKRFFATCLAMVLALSLLMPSFSLAATPKPISTIPYDELPPNVDGQYHYLLLCVDKWVNDSKKIGNTDGIVMVTLDTRAHRIMLTSFIRDALVKKPDGKTGRINYIAQNFSPEDLCRTISSHIGVKLEKYILFNFSQIQDIIDYLGGVDITITDAEASYLTRYAINKNATKPVIRGAGTYHFNGHAAVIYMRIRKAGGGGDFMRTQRVRTVLSTLADQCREITYEDAKALVSSVMEHTTLTNMNLDMMLTAMDQAFQLKECTIEELRIPPDGAVHPITFAGMAAQELDWVKCREAMADYLENSFLVLDEEQEEALQSQDDWGLSLDGGFDE